MSACEGELDAGGPLGVASEKPAQTEGQLQQQHKREIRELKQQTKRAGKKAHHEFKQLQVNMLIRHAEEMRALVSAASQEHQPADCDSLSANVHFQKSRAQRKREKRQSLYQAEQAQIASEIATVGVTQRQEEVKALDAVLRAHGLQVVDIPADGNCMYHALAHQLDIRGHANSSQAPPAARQLFLRDTAASYIQEHLEYFIPFVFNADSPGSEQHQMQQFIDGVKEHAWGSQVELQALASALGVQIQVFSSENPPVEMGEAKQSFTLQICYLHHAYTSGKHYNSVEPMRQIVPFCKGR